MNPNIAELRGSIDLLAILLDFTRVVGDRVVGDRSIPSDYFIICSKVCLDFCKSSRQN
ncbi:hypothetical protein QUB60_22820 [Microcoleus sp. A2-C5]|uniref:hypothetical protein n=1 Tax=Microcoleaceae TaxID=1892252 RepID=UPI002238BE55|nr:hypothetical protein [Lyngbya sp. CCAP 1446/10]MCW6053605.1 hypothetical protein [Lyngbya sp. CCAP 1446/10]